MLEWPGVLANSLANIFLPCISIAALMISKVSVLKHFVVCHESLLVKRTPKSVGYRPDCKLYLFCYNYSVHPDNSLSHLQISDLRYQTSLWLAMHSTTTSISGILM